MKQEQKPEALRFAEEFECFAIDHQPDGWPAIRQKQISGAAAELRRLHNENEELRHKLQTLAELGDAGDDVQLLRMGYAAARLEIESLKAKAAPAVPAGWKLVPVAPTARIELSNLMAAAPQAEPAKVLYDERAMLEIFEAARAGSDKPAGIIRGIRAVIASWEERSDAGWEDYAMNQEIIAMAREAGFVRAGSSGHLIFNDELERFYAMAVAKEREAWRTALRPVFERRMGTEQVLEHVQRAIRARSAA